MVDKAKEYFQTPITTIMNNALIDFQFNPVSKKCVRTRAGEVLHQFEGSIKGALNTVQACVVDMK